MDTLVQETNHYAARYIAKNTVATPWHPVTRNEFLAYIALNIAMGIINLPAIHDYWSTEEIISLPWFRSIMSRTRFYQITRFLHVTDNERARAAGIDKKDKLYKLRPFIDVLTESCKKHNYPNQALSIDESMIGTKCRIGFLQYLPKKPTKWGVKVWVLADAKSGYVHKFQVYTGKEENSSYGLAYRVVMDLLKDNLGKSHIVYCDNSYTSVLLAMDLLKQTTYLCGTLRQRSKNFPKEIGLKNFDLEKEKCEFRKHGDVTCVRWKEKRDVFLLSTKDRNEMTTAQRKGEGGQMRTLDAPVIVADYNENMGGVDIGDQLLVYYALGRKTVKWWHRVCNSECLFTLQRCSSL